MSHRETHLPTATSRIVRHCVTLAVATAVSAVGLAFMALRLESHPPVLVFLLFVSVLLGVGVPASLLS